MQFHLKILHFTPPFSSETKIDTINEKASVFLTSNCTETYQRLSEKDFEVLSQLNALQSLYNTARMMKNERLDETATAQLLMIAANLVEVLCNCADRLDPLSPRKYNPSTQQKIVSKSYHSSDVATEPSEKFVYERQALAVLALFCADYEHIIESLLFERMDALQATPNKQKDAEKYDPKYKKMSFIEALIEVLQKIGTSVSIIELSGVFFNLKATLNHLYFLLFVSFFTEIRSFAQRLSRIIIHIARSYSEELHTICKRRPTHS